MTSHFARHSHGSMDMTMDMGNSSSQGSMMEMVFQTDQATPLFSTAWTPRSSGAYAGTCIFLVLLAIIGRVLVAVKAAQENRWAAQDARRRYVAVQGKGPLAEQIARDPEAKTQVVMSENGVEETVYVVEEGRHASTRPWRFSVDPVRALLDTIIVGVGYLLMLAVMTMNVGYFMSVLAGVFVGSLAVGRYGGIPQH